MELDSTAAEALEQLIAYNYMLAKKMREEGDAATARARWVALTVMAVALALNLWVSYRTVGWTKPYRRGWQALAGRMPAVLYECILLNDRPLARSSSSTSRLARGAWW